MKEREREREREILLPKSVISIQQENLTLGSILEPDFSYH
jgi:hypothetical protein